MVRADPPRSCRPRCGPESGGRATFTRPLDTTRACQRAPRPIAYFSMEFGLSEPSHLQRRLGILAGDFLKAASDLGVPSASAAVAAGLFPAGTERTGNRSSSFLQRSGWLPVVPLRNAGVGLHHPAVPAAGGPPRAWVRPGRSLYLLDSNHLLNSPADRGITSELYGGGPEIRLQEMVLGIGVGDCSGNWAAPISAISTKAMQRSPSSTGRVLIWRTGSHLRSGAHRHESEALPPTRRSKRASTVFARPCRRISGFLRG